MINKKIKNLMYSALIGSLLFLTSCRSNRPDIRKETTTSPPGLPNPASAYCEGLGYREETRENDQGEYGVCIFPDGSECDTWDFLSGRCGQEHSYCQQQGYDLISEEGSNIAFCLFPDGSSCSEIDFFTRDCGPENPSTPSNE